MLEQLQGKHSAWAAEHNAALTPLLASYGILEEACELLRAAAKFAAFDRRGCAVRYTREQILAMYADAVGDCTLYCLSRCTATAVDFSTAVRHAGMPPKPEQPLSACRRVVEAALDAVARPDDKLAAVWVLSALQDAARAAGVDFEKAVLEAWAAVSIRRPDR